MAQRFEDRHDGGRQLAEALEAYRGRPHTVVLALPRGGVPVACEVGQALGLPVDVLIVRKLGLPGQPELAMGAIASGGVRVENEEVVRMLGIQADTLDRVAAEELPELRRRERVYRGGRPAAPLGPETTAIIVDDGIATGSTMHAAVEAVRKRGVKEVVVAVPAAAPDSVRALEVYADRVVSVITPDPYYAVGLWYEDFAQLDDEEVRRQLARAPAPGGERDGEP